MDEDMAAKEKEAWEKLGQTVPRHFPQIPAQKNPLLWIPREWISAANGIRGGVLNERRHILTDRRPTYHQSKNRIA